LTAAWADRGHDAAARPSRLQHQHPIGGRGLALDPGAALDAAQLLVGDDQIADRFEAPHTVLQHGLEGERGHHERALHVADPRAGGAVGGAREGPPGDGSGRPDRVGMAQDHQPPDPAESARRGHAITPVGQRIPRDLEPVGGQALGQQGGDLIDPELVIGPAVDIHQPFGQGQHLVGPVAQTGEIAGCGTGHGISGARISKSLYTACN
jgi:hypothetical protein